MSNPVITIIDYKAGNLASVRKAVEHFGFHSVLTEEADEVRRAERILLPGVGHFSATNRLHSTGVTEAVREVIARGVPFMGICVGMQWMFDGSTEDPAVAGLGLFKGMCERFSFATATKASPLNAASTAQPATQTLKVPHVGWNTIHRVNGNTSRLLEGIPKEGFVYYTHSYRAPVVDGVVATTNYGEDFAAVVERDNVFGVQFHPEKSSDVGLRMLANFCGLKD